MADSKLRKIEWTATDAEFEFDSEEQAQRWAQKQEPICFTFYLGNADESETVFEIETDSDDDGDAEEIAEVELSSKDYSVILSGAIAIINATVVFEAKVFNTVTEDSLTAWHEEQGGWACGSLDVEGAVFVGDGGTAVHLVV